jgi:hypothetical protein
MAAAHTNAPSQPSLAVIAVAAIMVVGLAATAFSYGRSVLQIAEQNNALVIASENQTFCESLGLVAQSENYRNCLRRLEAMRVLHEHLWQAEAAGIL